MCSCALSFWNGVRDRFGRWVWRIWLHRITVEMEGKGKHRIEAARRALGSGLAVKYTWYSKCMEKGFCVSNRGMCIYTQIILSCLMYVLFLCCLSSSLWTTWQWLCGEVCSLQERVCERLPSEKEGEAPSPLHRSVQLVRQLEVTQVMHNGSLCQQVMCVMTQSARENWKTRSSTLDKTCLKVCYVY